MPLWAICSAVMCLVLSVWDVRTDFHIVSWMDQIQICKSREGGIKKKKKKTWGWSPNNFVKTYIGEEMQYPVNIHTLLLTSYLWLTSSQLHSLRGDLCRSLHVSMCSSARGTLRLWRSRQAQGDCPAPESQALQPAWPGLEPGEGSHLTPFSFSESTGLPAWFTWKFNPSPVDSTGLGLNFQVNHAGRPGPRFTLS